jgi:FkbM family methyltransferase
MEEALRHLASLGFSPSVVVDVGTAFGTFELLRVFPNSQYLWVEPLREFEQDLKRLAAQYRGEYVMRACGAQGSDVIMHVHPNLTGSSILCETEGPDADGTPRQVPMSRLDDLLEGHQMEGDLLLKVDVQGAELEVLEGAGHLLPRFDVVILEVSLFHFLKTNPDLHDVVVYMKHKGFVAYDIVGGANRLLDGAVAYKDIVFVKEAGRFRQSHRWATPDQRRAYIAEYRRRNPVQT